MSQNQSWQSRSNHLCSKLGIRVPILLAPMAGACPVLLSSAVANQGGLGACGVLLMKPAAIAKWASEFKAQSNGAFQMNNWIPDPPAVRNAKHETEIKNFIARWHLETNSERVPADPPDFESQAEAMLAARPRAISSIMGIYAEDYVSRMKAAGILWLATATTVEEARIAHEAGADAIVAQGFEAGGHRGTFVAEQAEETAAGLFSLLPAIVDSVPIPVIATGAIADCRGVAAALMLGASAVQIGTGFLRTPEAALPSTWSDAIGESDPDNTQLTRAFSGRLGRSIATEYVMAANSSDAPASAPYPVQRSLTSAMTAKARRGNDLARMQAWAGQSGKLAANRPAADIVNDLWQGALQLLP